MQFQRLNDKRLLCTVLLNSACSTGVDDVVDYQGGICQGGGRGDMSWSLIFDNGTKWPILCLMCYGHSILSPSLTLPTNTTR